MERVVRPQPCEEINPGRKPNKFEDGLRERSFKRDFEQSAADGNRNIEEDLDKALAEADTILELPEIENPAKRDLGYAPLHHVPVVWVASKPDRTQRSSFPRIIGSARTVTALENLKIELDQAKRTVSLNDTRNVLFAVAVAQALTEDLVAWQSLYSGKRLQLPV
jgi:hypothetical protein